MPFSSVLSSSYKNTSYSQETSTATFTATSTGNSLQESITNAFNTFINNNLNNSNITENILSLDITTNSMPQFRKIIENLNMPPCVIFDNSNNLYITTDGYPNKLLKYNENYMLEEFVSDEAWLYGPNNNLPKTPVSMAFNKDFTYMYVVNFTHNSITVIKMSDYTYQTLQLTPTDISNVGKKGYRLNGPNGLTFDSTYSYMIATNIEDSNLVKITINQYSPNMAIISPFNENVPFTQPILITNDNTLPNNNFYVSDLSQSIVYKVNDASYSEFEGPTYIFQPRGVSFNTNYYNKLWVTNSTNEPNTTIEYPIVSVDVETSSIVNILINPLFNNPRGVLFDKDNYMYICNFGTIGNNGDGSILKSINPFI